MSCDQSKPKAGRYFSFHHSVWDSSIHFSLSVHVFFFIKSFQYILLFTKITRNCQIKIWSGQIMNLVKIRFQFLVSAFFRSKVHVFLYLRFKHIIPNSTLLNDKNRHLIPSPQPIFPLISRKTPHDLQITLFLHTTVTSYGSSPINPTLNKAPNVLA